MSSASSGAAQDLSFADQQELLAFIEKRNWFEQKLDSLKALAPVYPFVHPHLVADPKSTAGYVRAGADTSPWRLPDRAQLSAWVSERNALEDEVARFDDGDMDRMKEKTRQMTRVPLTQPSTDLVEVTLDLILLIDQLLTVLRRRGAVLELASLRLQWDDLRYEVSRESESVNAEIQHVVSEAQAWIPGVPAPERPERLERRTSTKLLTRPPLHSSPSTSSLPESGVPPSPSTPPASPGKPPPSPSARKVPSSPTKTTGGPKSSLHLSILRSQLVGLQSRQRNFSITLVKRSSTILDKMIDAASRLDGLGGINGPLEEGVKTKNIPEELIDLQDAIEENASAMADRVNWCGQFETQCRQAHQHYTASLHAQHIAGEVLVELEKALTAPASSTQHASLAKHYAEATKVLPPVLDGKFPRPSHPEYPSKDTHNERLVEALMTAREAAAADVDLAGKGLAFYSGMVKARDALLAQHQRVQTLRTQLTQTMEQLERGTASVPRPNVEMVAQQGGDCSEWLQRASTWISTGDEVVRSAFDTHQSTTLAAMQYRKALVSAPMAVKKYLPPNGVPDDLGPVVDDDTSDLIELARRCAELTKTTKAAADTIPLVLCIRHDSDEVVDDVTTLQDNIVLAINNAAWSSRTSDWPTPEFDDHITKLSERAVDLDRDMQRLKAMTNAPAVSKPLFQKVADVHSKISESRRTLETFNRVSEQARVVLAVQSEAEALLADLNTAREGVPSNNDTRAVAASVAEFRQRVATWNDTLTQRAVFVSNDPPTLDRSTSHDHSDGPLTPPLTPVEGSSAVGTTMPDLVALDGRVRSELNRQSARVGSALSNLISTAEQVAFERWAEPVIKATTTLEAANDKLGVVIADLTSTMGKMKAVEGEERKTLATEAQKSARETLPEPIIEVQQCIAALNTALSGSAASHVDMRHAADVFSSADVAREAGLARITETEEWQQQVSRLILESEVKLQKQKAALLKQKAQSLQPGTQSRSASTTQETARELADKLAALDLETVVRPSPIVLRNTPKARRIPSSAVAKKLATTFTSIKDSARALENSKKSGDVDTLFSKLKRASALVPELGGLGAVSDAAAACDKAFSSLLDTIDTGDKAKIKAAQRKAENTVEAFKKAARQHKLDQRVVDEQKRIMLAWDDLRSLADDEPLKSSTSTAGSVGSAASRSRSSTVSRSSTMSRSSTAPSLASLLSDNTVVVPKKKPVRNKPLKPARNISMPPPELPKKLQPPELPRPRVASAGDTPSKPPKIQTTPAMKRQPTLEKRSSSESIKSTPRNRPRSSMPFATPSSSKLKPTIPQPFNLSGTGGGLTRSTSATTSLSELATPTRNRGPRMSAPPRTPVLAPTPKVRRPAQATKLDQAVAKVLDDLEVDVPVVPVGRESPEQWHDESGRYWIGTGGKARLCFCRILRSRTVMVRVGGGWVELSRYLMDRFADALADAPPLRETMSMSPPDWRRVPLAITSASLAAGLGTVRSEGSPGGVPRTPLRKPLPPFDAASGSNGTAGLLDPVTPERLATLSPTSQSSPLVPLQFMRKASESPSIREKEREQLRSRPSFPREGSAGL